MKLAAFLLAASTVAAVGQQLPDAPRPQPMTKQDWTYFAADGFAGSLDVISTTRMLHNGGHERFLPDCISHHPFAMASYTAARVTTEFLAMRRLERHHLKLSHRLMEAEILSTSYWDISNFTIHK